MRGRTSLVRGAAVLLAAIVLAGCGTTPPPSYPTGVVDLGPLGSYGWSGAMFAITANTFHSQSGSEHLVRFHVNGTNAPDATGALFVGRSSSPEDAVLPAVGEYTSGVDGWELKVYRNRHEYEVTSLTITEVSYDRPVNESPDPATVELSYGMTRVRATFTFLLPSGEEAEGFVRVD